ncbi:MAG: C4-dicarboxylate ABC transporter permease [Gracilibacter sp. BRH_c7a]|nr:MAG: C4-dicarboxylate ABC transporter permease [Gracilibacter sp. BRH_c7a]
MMSFLIFATLIICILISIPIAFALGIASVFALTVMGHIPLVVVVQRLFTTNDSFPLMALPFFMLAGELMTAGGVSKRIVLFASSIIGHFRGGLGTISIVSSAFFASLSGSNAATVAAIGSVMIPEMEKKGYDREYTAATVAAAGIMGAIIPPSVLMVLYAIIAGVSIGDLFIAGFIPGVLICITFSIYNWFICKGNKNIELAKWRGWKEVGKTFISAFWALLMPLIIMGGIYTGVCTPTESAAIAVFYALFVGFFVYRELKVKMLPKIILKSAVASGIIMFVLNNAGLFGWVITANNIPQNLAQAMATVSSSQAIFLILVNIMLLLVGSIMSAAAAIPIFAAILLPAAINFGVDPLLFGVIMVVNLCIGTITPPLGSDLFVASALTKLPIERIAFKIWPYILIAIVDLLIITYYPPLSMIMLKIL